MNETVFPTGLDMAAGAQLAVKMVNNRSLPSSYPQLVSNFTLRVVFEDTDATPSGALNKVRTCTCGPRSCVAVAMGRTLVTLELH